jgi:hypothetical protein
MKKLLYMLSAMSLIAGLALIIGCSDDDETTGPVVKATGDPDAVEFEAALGVIAFIGEMNWEMLDGMSGTIDSVMTRFAPTRAEKIRIQNLSTGIMSDSFYLTYHADSKYWYAFFQAVDTGIVGDSQVVISVTYEDSIQFLHGTEVVQWPDSALLSGVNCGASSIMLNLFDWWKSFEAHQQVSVVGGIFGDGDVAINSTATAETDVSGELDGYSCTFDVDLGITLTNVALNLEATESDGCPTSGTAQYTGVIDMACDNDTSFTLNDQWSLIQTFSDTTIHYVVENSTTRWEFDETCNGKSTMAFGNRVPANFNPSVRIKTENPD